MPRRVVDWLLERQGRARDARRGKMWYRPRRFGDRMARTLGAGLPVAGDSPAAEIHRRRWRARA
jgi:hypothetical protein